MMKRVIVFLLLVMLVMTGCRKVDDDKKVGVLMPTMNSQRWRQDGLNLQNSLRGAGYSVELQYADNDTAEQMAQFDALLKDGCRCFILSAVDSFAMGTLLEKARSVQAKVIAYDRLLMNSDAVTCYVSFDNLQVGRLMGQYIETQLKLKTEKGPFTIEFFGGDLQDNNTKDFYQGAMEVLKPYLTEGKLVVPSQQVALQQIAARNWLTTEAQKRMEKILKSHYGDGKTLDAVLAFSDDLANGVIKALNACYQGNYPVITGQDCTLESVRAILQDKQSMSVFKDTRALATRTALLVDTLMRGGTLPDEGMILYNNGGKEVPSFFCKPMAVDKENYQRMLIDSGYYKSSQVK